MTTRTLRTRLLLLVAALVAAVLATLAATALWRLGEAAAGYTAKVLCSCVFVSGRPEAGCIEDDAGAPARFVSARVDRDARTASARAWIGPTASAAFRPGLGCTLD